MLSYHGGGVLPGCRRLSTAANPAAAVGRAHDGDHHLDQADDGEDGVGCDSTVLFDNRELKNHSVHRVPKKGVHGNFINSVLLPVRSYTYIHYALSGGYGNTK